MIDHNGAWLPSVWIGIPVLAVSVLICLCLIVLAIMKAGDGFEAAILGGMPGLAALALIVVPLFGYWPYQDDYHRLQPVTGTVKTIETRAFDSLYVVTYVEGATVRCDDSRCANVKPGDQLRLLCTKEFEYGAVNGWACRWGQS